jgi:hypothetical protein
MNNIEEKEFYIQLPENRSLSIGADGMGLCLSFHFRSGHVMFSMERHKAFEVLEAIQNILTPERD